jgi:hypothetical protein
MHIRKKLVSRIKSKPGRRDKPAAVAGRRRHGRPTAGAAKRTLFLQWRIEA